MNAEPEPDDIAGMQRLRQRCRSHVRDIDDAIDAVPVRRLLEVAYLLESMVRFVKDDSGATTVSSDLENVAGMQKNEP